MISRDQIVRWIENSAEVLADNKEHLTELDAAIGDADHGVNMDRGFRKVIDRLPEAAEKDIGTILKMVSMALISSVGGAAGPLYGTFFQRAAMTADGKQTMSGNELGQLLRAGLEGVIQRGRARLGDKTMVDALSPAIEAYRQALSQGADTRAALEQCVGAAEKGLKDTIPMIAKKGRASYLGERSEGYQDPGATSSYLILKALMDSVTP